MSLFVKKFGKYLRRSFNPATTSFNSYNKSDRVSTDLKCYNCDRPGHFAADCNRPKKDDRYKREDRRADDRYRKEERYRRDDDEDERTVEKSKDNSKDKYKERSSDRKMKSNNNKRFSHESSSSSSSSESEQEEVHCLMADQTDEDEVFDFSNVEFTRDDLVIELNDMVKEYRKLSHSFEEAKAENNSLKSSSAESSSDEQEDADTLKTELSKLQAENELLRNEISELKAEVAKSTVEMSSYNKSTITLQKICESQKQASDKTGIGFNNSELCEGESSTQSRPAYDKFNKMSFVKADMLYNCLESVKYDNQNSPKLNENGKAGIGFSKPESSKPDWLKNRLEKDKAKASYKPSVPHQSWHNSKKDFEAPLSAEEVLSEDEKTSLDDILLSIPVDIPLPSTCMEVTQIKMGQMIKNPGVTQWTWFLKQLPSIPAEDKGKELLEEKDPVRGNPAKEHYSLICADIDLLVSLRAKFIDEVAAFFHSFSLRKLSSINFEEMYNKEDQVLRWGETESPQIAIQRKFYILLKYRTILVWKFLDAWRINFAPGQGSSAVDIHVIELLTELYLSLLEELAKEVRILGLPWTKSCCSKIFEGYPGDRGAVIARTNTTTRSLCWIRRKFLVNGVWRVEQCADMWVKIPRKVVSTEVLRQRQYDDTLPSMSVFFKLLRKRWADVCLEAVEFCVQRLLPVGSSQFCKSLQIVESASSFAPSNVDATASSRLPISQDLSALFADFQATLSEQLFESQSNISSKLHKIEQTVRDSLSDQAAVFKSLSQEARQENRTLDDVHTIRFNEFRKHVLAQNASIFVGLADVRKEVQDVNAKVDIMADRLNAIQKDAEATKEAHSHQILEFHSQAQENHAVIHAQLSELVDYIHRGRADKKGEISGSRGPQQPADTQISGSAVTPSFEQRVEMAKRRIVQTVINADTATRESQEAAERDRERRRKEAQSLKRRRRD
ncbi:hypothetical protein F511_26907 [Dorcoceras hygrometricum]|uniref:CCHC-type domain-containing protein n=1 Tax=Dorcoceras hygrometricum TaxID=472368 RepID=A0A2Z7AA51_9LAMI|nr:hypothetical protein F511_26907 [Dorcoceras hygrometricum]